MRPLELRVRNFRSYFGDDSVFDFRGRGLVGIVGPIGSGKSSLLDAVAFALYGRTPIVGSSTKSLIHQRADGGAVSLRFAVDDEVWEVTRSLRRKGQSVHALVRLSEDTPDAERLDTFVLEADVNSRVVALLGLEFQGFERSVMLAQGRFAQFLSSKPAERDKVLKGVFGHDRIDVMRAAAKQREAGEAAKEEMLGVRLEAADALGTRIEASKGQLAIDEARLELLQKAESKITDHSERLDATGRVIAHAATRLAELEPLVDRLPPVEIVNDVVKISKSADQTRQRVADTLDAAQAELRQADGALAALEPAQLRQRIDEAARLEATRDQFNVQRQSVLAVIELKAKEAEIAAVKLADEEEALEQATASRKAAAAALQASRGEFELAVQALHDAQQNDMAGTLRAELHVGEECPVCSQQVATLPSSMAASDVKAAAEAKAVAAESVADGELAVVAAETVIADRRDAVTALGAALRGLEQEREHARKQLVTIDTNLTESANLLAELTGGETVAAMRSSIDAAEAAVTSARKKVDQARSEHDDAIRSAQEAAKELGALRLSLAELATRLDVALDGSDDVDAVGQAVSDVRQAWADTVETLTTAKNAAEHERSEIVAADKALRQELGIEGDFTAQLAAVLAATELRSQQIEADEATLAESAAIRDARTAAAAARATYGALSAELTDSRFVRYLLDEEKRELANLGSEHFERLSSGRYRFSVDGNFEVVDLTSADAVRKAESLSGGETFLASLALALALAEMVARTGGRLDAFFLDEGFGSLDMEHLDLAMEGIENLAAGAADRLVLVVSHVPDMRDRIEDLIELDRHPVTGDTIVVHA